jgi:hypothetical protein
MLSKLLTASVLSLGLATGVLAQTATGGSSVGSGASTTQGTDGASQSMTGSMDSNSSLDQGSTGSIAGTSDAPSNEGTNCGGSNENQVSQGVTEGARNDCQN